MKIRISIDDKKEEKMVVPEKSTVKDVLNKLGINRLTVIVMKNSEVVIEEEDLNENDHVEIRTFK